MSVHYESSRTTARPGTTSTSRHGAARQAFRCRGLWLGAMLAVQFQLCATASASVPRPGILARHLAHLPAAPPTALRRDGRTLTQVSGRFAPPSDGATERTSAEVTNESAPAPDPLVRAQELFAEGSALYETANYAGAIEAWTAAYALVPAEPSNADIRSKLIYDIAAAQEKAFDIDQSRDHLEQARILFETYLENIESVGLAMVDLERERAGAQGRLQQLVARLEKYDRLEAERLKEERAASKRTSPPGVPMIALGSVALSIGIGGAAMGAAGAVIGSQANDISQVPVSDIDARQAQFERGRMGNTMLIAGATIGTLGVGVGVALLVLGVKRRQAARSQVAVKAAGLQQHFSLSARPSVGTRHVGLILSGRF